jgi:hypothetical protein
VARAQEAPREEAAPPVIVSPQVVAYVGTSGVVRIIPKASWDAAGVTDQEEVTWGPQNGWEVPIDKFSDAALTWIGEREPDLMVKTVEVPRV